MSQPVQLALFGPQVGRKPVPRRRGPALPAGFELQAADDSWHVLHQGRWIGTIYHLGGKVWNLYHRNERGVCGFGGPHAAGAVAELHRRHQAREKGRRAARA